MPNCRPVPLTAVKIGKFRPLLEPIRLQDLVHLARSQAKKKIINNLFAEGEVNLGEYSARFTEPEANNCFSLIFRGEYQELRNEELKRGNNKHKCSLAYV